MWRRISSSHTAPDTLYTDMQFCSLHHRVLLFIIIILTLNTAPGSSLDVCSTRGILHHPVKLPCKHQCSGLLKWALLYDRDVVQAQCDQTSCWSEKGFNISHDQYLRGDLSLTITAANYSLRNIYACECGDSDFSFVRLIIETVISQVQMESGEDLKLHVSVPEPVEVIYKSSGSSDEVICRVNKTSLWCKDEYRDRTSLTYPEITLRHMEPRDSGRYTIRDTKNEEDIEIYAVSVEEKPFPTWGIVLIVLLILLCCAAVGTYLLWKQRKRIQLNRLKEVIENMIREVLEDKWINRKWESLRELEEEMMNREGALPRQTEEEHNDTENLNKPAERQIKEKIREVKEKLNYIQDQYKNTEYSDEVSEFCREKRSLLLIREVQLVARLVQQAVRGTVKTREVEEKISDLLERYKDTEYSTEAKSLCIPLRELALNRRLLPMVQLVQQAEREEDISKVEKELDELEELYKDTGYSEDVSKFCSGMKLQLSSKKPQNYEELKTERDEFISKLEQVMDGLEKIRDEVGRGSNSAAEIKEMQEDLKMFIEPYKEKRREEKRRGA